MLRTVLQAVFYCVASHPEVEAKCLEEIQKTTKAGSDHIDTEQLVYCNAVVMEATRLYPTNTVLTRKLEKPLKLDTVTLPTGTDVVIPIWHIQRDDRHFPRALEFLPERWVKRNDDGLWVQRDTKEGEEGNSCGHISSDRVIPVKSKSSFLSADSTVSGHDPEKYQVENGEMNILKHSVFDREISAASKDAYLTFSAGGRSCPGHKLSNAQMAIFLAELLRHFKFDLAPGAGSDPVIVCFLSKAPRRHPRDYLHEEVICVTVIVSKQTLMVNIK